MVGISVAWTTVAFWGPLRQTPTGSYLVLIFSPLQKFNFLTLSSPVSLCIFCVTVSLKARQPSTHSKCTRLTNGTSVMILEKYFQSMYILVLLTVFLSVGELLCLDEHVMYQLVRYPGDYMSLFKGTSCLFVQFWPAFMYFFGSLLFLPFFFPQTCTIVFKSLRKLDMNVLIFLFLFNNYALPSLFLLSSQFRCD